MTGATPPRLGVVLLQRFLHDNEPLVGDLLEGFAVRRSRFWFWRQLFLAIAIRSFQQRDQEGPLGLGRHSGCVAAEPAPNTEPRRINLTASPLPGIGGLGLVALATLVAVVKPEALWIFLPAIPGGVALGLTMAIVRRRAALSTPAPSGRTLLRD